MSEGFKVGACVMIVFGVPAILIWEFAKWVWPFLRAWLHAVTG